MRKPILPIHQARIHACTNATAPAMHDHMKRHRHRHRRVLGSVPRPGRAPMQPHNKASTLPQQRQPHLPPALAVQWGGADQPAVPALLAGMPRRSRAAAAATVGSPRCACPNQLPQQLLEGLMVWVDAPSRAFGPVCRTLEAANELLPDAANCCCPTTQEPQTNYESWQPIECLTATLRAPM